MEKLKRKKNQEISFRSKALSVNSKSNYKTGVSQYLNYLEKNGQGEGTDSVKSWLEEIKKTKSPATYNLRAQALKEYLLEKYKGDLPQLFGIQETFKAVRRAKVEKKVLEDDYLTYDQVQDLSNRLTERMSLIFRALFWTGARVSELINVKLEDIKVNGKATIRIKSGKGDKERTVYLPLALYEEVMALFSGTTYLFETKGGKQYHRVNVWKELNRQANSHGYTVHPHSLRHGKAMYLKTHKQLTPDQIAKALGHASVTTTLESYFHGTPTAEEQGIEDAF